MIKIVTFNFKEFVNKLISCVLLTVLFFLIITRYALNFSFDINKLKYALYSVPIISNKYKDQDGFTNINISILKRENVLILRKNMQGQKEVVKENINKTNINSNLTISDINSKKYTIKNNLEKICISNNTSYDIEYNSLLKAKTLINKNTTILIVHTHGSESYKGINHTDYYRTENKEENIIRVGNELENILKNSGYKVIHDESLYDYPTYSGSYTRALKSIVEMIKQNNEIGIVLDIHRDAAANNDDFAPTTNINGEDISQLMIIAGTAEGGLEHPNWEENLKFALKLQNVGEEIYPGLFRTMIITKSRYNQHTTNGSLIIEVGATGNTLEQSVNSMKYLAKILDVVLENGMEE